MTNIRVDYENDRILVGDVAVSVTGPEGEPLAIDHVGAQDGYVAFLEPGENGGVKSNGAGATVVLESGDQ